MNRILESKYEKSKIEVVTQSFLVTINKQHVDLIFIEKMILKVFYSCILTIFKIYIGLTS